MKPVARRWVNVGAFAFAIVVNALVNVLKLGGNTTGDVSDRFNAVFTPAAYVFSIWAVIYAWLFLYVVYQALPASADAPFQREIGLLFAINMVANGAWMICWHLEWILATLVLMVIILLTLVLIYTRLGIGTRHVKPLDNWLVRAPFSLYLGWISVAIIANASVLLIDRGWGRMGLREADWAVIMLLVATALSSAISFLRRDWLAAAVFVWAFVGLFMRNLGVEGRTAVAIVALVCAVLAAAAAVCGLIWGKRPKPAAPQPVGQSPTS